MVFRLGLGQLLQRLLQQVRQPVQHARALLWAPGDDQAGKAAQAASTDGSIFEERAGERVALRLWLPRGRMDPESTGPDTSNFFFCLISIYFLPSFPVLSYPQSGVEVTCKAGGTTNIKKNTPSKVSRMWQLNHWKEAI